jgi:uncharacterized protein YqhQ
MSPPDGLLGYAMALELIDNCSETPRKEVGGQALLEGVMMKSRTGYAVAARRADGAIVLLQVPYKSLSESYRWLKAPFVRGVVALVEMLVIGTRALQWSAGIFESNLRDEGRKSAENPLPQSVSEGWSQQGFLFAILASLGFAAILVVVLPHSLALGFGLLPGVREIVWWMGASSFDEATFPVLFHLVSGIFRALIVVCYIAVISLNRDIRRVFGYHAAEHQAAWAFEKGDDLTVDRVRTFPRVHPRCGTAFLATVLLISIVVFALGTGLMQAMVEGYGDWPWWQRKVLVLPLHLALLPLIGALSFEALKASARNPDRFLARLALSPGLLLQRMTTRRSDEGQLEVAIVALRAALAIHPEMRDVQRFVVQGLHSDYVDQRVRPWNPQTSGVNV